MSAFIVPDNHIHSILTYAKKHLGKINYNERNVRLFGSYANDEINELGQILVNANYRSVNTRYPKDNFFPTTPHKYNYRSVCDISAIEVIKACHCLDYQSCEFDGWEKSDAYKILQNIIQQATYKLENYESAPWVIS